jgi:aminoglycoside phosphotransferase (APT) family kinase protein
MLPDAIVSSLRSAELLDEGDFAVRTLSGGVSCDIWLVETTSRRFVVKRALDRLRVRDQWLAHPRRNLAEQNYLRRVGQIVPQGVPRLLYGSADPPLFAMEYLGPEYRNWKSMLLAGEARVEDAEGAGTLLGRIHAATWEKDEFRREFDTTEDFHALRTDPYLLTTGSRHPELNEWFIAEAQRLEATRLCLVHGDYSPKNLMVGPDRMVLLDCEVAWFGDPAFDVAFLLNHLVLKSLHLLDRRQQMLHLLTAAWIAYRACLRPEDADSCERRTTRLLPMLMLARIDGKSPVEYLTDESKREFVRQFVREILTGSPPDTLAAFCDRWQNALSKAFT